MSVVSPVSTISQEALEVLRRAGNPFRNYFARNPDDESCARYHVHELFRHERSQLLGLVDLYRYDPATHSEMVPILGNKGAGKTHLLYSIKHGESGSWQMLVTPGSYQKSTDFLEYLLFQVIETLLGGATQQGGRPLDFVGEEVSRRLLRDSIQNLSPADRLELFPASGLQKIARRFGIGTAQPQEHIDRLISILDRPLTLPVQPGDVRRLCEDAELDLDRAFEAINNYVETTEAHSTAGIMRGQILKGFCRSALFGDESDLASFLTYGFAELEFHVRPTRGDLVLALFKSLMYVLRELRIPVVVAFDQLEDLLLARRSDDAHQVAEAFFAGIVQAMHQIDGICFLIFAERGLWNRFVPSLDGYIQDRLNNPVHLPEHGTIQALRLELPPPDLVKRVVEQRLRPTLQELPSFLELSSIFPFTEEQVDRIAKTEPTLRDMLQQFRHLFDHLVYGTETAEAPVPEPKPAPAPTPTPTVESTPRITPEPEAKVKSVIQVDTTNPAEVKNEPRPTPTESNGSQLTEAQILDLWEQEVRSAKRKLEPDGSLTGATRELQAGLGLFLQTCFEHGVKVGPWRLSHVVPEWNFGDHPTYGSLTIGHWACKDGQPWKVGIGLFLGRGSAKPRDLGTKLGSLEVEPTVVDHLILLRPEEDFNLSGKTKAMWQDTEKRGRHARLEAVRAEEFALLYATPRWLSVLTETLPAGQEIPNLADLIQERCERLLEQVCMPVQNKF